MATNILVDVTELYKAFKLRQAMPVSLPNPDSLPQDLLNGVAAQNVDVVPPIAEPSTRRTITWKFVHAVVANDAGTLRELRDIIDAALAPIGAVVGMASGPTGLANGANVLRSLLNVAEEITAILDVDSKDALINTETFTVRFGRDQADQAEKFVGYQLFLRSRWINGDPDEEDNKGTVRAQEFSVDNVTTGSPGTLHASGRGRTDVYPRLLFRGTRRLGMGRNTHAVSYDILSHVESDSKVFMNFSTEAILQIDVADSEAALTEAMRVAMADGSPPTDGEPVSFPEGDSEETEGSGGVEVPYDPGDEYLIAISAEVVPTTREARRLVKDIVKRRIDHVGLELGKRPLDELTKIAEGLGIADAPSDRRELAVAIIRGLRPGGGGGGGIRTNIRSASASELEALRREAEARRTRLSPPAAK